MDNFDLTKIIKGVFIGAMAGGVSMIALHRNKQPPALSLPNLHPDIEFLPQNQELMSYFEPLMLYSPFSPLTFELLSLALEKLCIFVNVVNQTETPSLLLSHKVERWMMRTISLIDTYSIAVQKAILNLPLEDKEHLMYNNVIWTDNVKRLRNKTLIMFQGVQDEIYNRIYMNA